MDNRIKFIDGLRGLAAIWVAILHFPFTLGIDSIDKISSRGYLGVDLFSIISGFVVYYSFSSKHKPLLNFYKDRFLRLYSLIIPAAVAFVISISFESDRNQFLEGILFFFTISYSSYLGGQHWSLGNELIFYIVSPLIYMGLNFLSNRRRLLTSFLFINLLFFIWYFGYIRTIPSVASNSEILGVDVWRESGFFLKFYRGSGFERMFFEYLLGILAAFWFLKLNPPQFRYFSSFFVFTIMGFFYLYGVRGDIFIVFMISLYFLLINSRDPLKAILEKKPFQFLGKISFSIYVWHSLFAQLFRDNFNANELGIQKVLILQIVYFLSVLLASAFSYQIFEVYFYRFMKKSLHA